MRGHSVRQSMVLVVAALSVFALMLALVAASAQASYEFTRSFGAHGELGQLDEGATGVAVNEATGDVYVADGQGSRVLMFNAEGEFRLAWGWGVTEAEDKLPIDRKVEFERCGPELDTECTKERGYSGEGVGQLGTPKGIAVDQATGDVYVQNAGDGSGVVEVFSANGEKVIASFGVTGEADPEQIGSTRESGIAVNAAGDVYIVDNKSGNKGRVMIFKPTVPGKYENYSYAVGDDLASSLNPYRVAVDSAGDVFIDGNNATRVYKLAAGDLGSPAWKIEKNCTIEGLAADWVTGESFFYCSREETTRTGEKMAKGFYRLSPSGLEIEDPDEFPGVPGEAETEGLAYNHSLVWSAGRPAGVLYGVDSSLREGLAFARPATHPPSAVSGSLSVSGVGETSVSLEASIDPHGHDTRYRFEYGLEDCSTHPCTEVPIGGVDLGSGQTALPAHVTVAGLEPGVTYHYRVLAGSFCNEPPEQAVECPAEGEEEQLFTTYGAGVPGLPDGRVYELVSPLSKDGGEVFPLQPFGINCPVCTMPGLENQHFPMQSAPDGNTVVYEGGPFSASGDAIDENEYLSSRSAGWQTRDLSPASIGEGGGFGYRAFSSDLSSGVLSAPAPSLSPEAPEGYPDLYLQNTASGGALTPLLTAQDVEELPEPLHRGPSGSGSNETRLRLCGYVLGL